MLSARENPFSTDRVEQIRFMPQSESWSELIERLEIMDYRAAAIGPDGSGKTTFLEDLKQQLKERGIKTQSIFVTMDIKVSWKQIKQTLDARAFDVLLLDGADHLNRMTWYRLKRRILRIKKGLVITSHKPDMLPTLMRCSTSIPLLQNIVSQLAPEYAQPPQIEKLFTRHEGNIRNALRTLYDEAAFSNHSDNDQGL